MPIRAFWLALCAASLLLASCGSPAPSEQAAAPTATARSTVAPSATTVPSATPAPTVTATPTATPEPTPEPTVEPTVIAADVNDTAHLSEQVAPAEIRPVAAVQPAQPTRLQIPAINLDYAPISVGLDANRIPIVPKHDVGWYNLSAMPGQGENIVFWGHVLRFKATPKIPAPFARVKELKVGDEIIVSTAMGEQARYRVSRAVQVTPDQVEYILPTGREQLTLVSCIGDNVIVGGSVTKKYRLVTIAELVQ